jgi:hypothetical protein
MIITLIAVLHIKFHTNLQIIFLIYLFLLVHAGNVWMTMAITHQSIFLNKHLFVLHLDFPFELSDNNFLAKDTVQLETEISLRQAVSDASICDGQRFTKCGCSASGKSRCNTTY